MQSVPFGPWIGLDPSFLHASCMRQRGDPRCSAIIAALIVELATPHGLARAHLTNVADARAAIVLGHGAGGGVAARDLTASAAAARAEGLSVVLVEQPYRVAGRRAPAPAHHLDAAWAAVIAALRQKQLRGLPLIVGGRSSGARVACRTAQETGAAGVLCLAFPLQPPRRAGAAPAASRQAELDAVTVPTLVVQGVRDPFGTRPAARFAGSSRWRAITACGPTSRRSPRPWPPGCATCSPAPELAPGALDGHLSDPYRRRGAGPRHPDQPGLSRPGRSSGSATSAAT